MAGLTLNPGEKDPRKIVDVVRQLIEGRNNATGRFTLAVNVTTTTVQAVNCSPGSHVDWSALTAHAAAEPTMYYVAGKGQFVLTHTSTAVADRTFSFVVLG